MPHQRNDRLFLPHVMLALLLVAACGDRQASSHIVPLQYDTALAKANFPNPAARLTFNGRTAWFIFDTGAGVHTLASWFVDAAGMKIDDSLAGAVRARDATGEPVEFRAVRNQVGRLADGTALTLKVAMVASFSPEFEAAEVGGLLSPQLLAGDGQAAALDLRFPELRIETFKDAVNRLGGRLVAGDQVRICGETAATVPNLVFAVLVKAKSAEGWLILDTGAEMTSLTAGSSLVRGVKLGPGGETVGAAGQRQAHSLARNVLLSFSGYRMTVDPHVVQESVAGCGPDGFLGLDAMGTCAFVLGQDSLAVACGSSGT